MKLDIQALRLDIEKAKTVSPDESFRLQVKVLASLPALLDRLEVLQTVNAEWVELAKRANQKRDHDVVWVVERNYGTATTDDWRYMKYPGPMDDAWTSDWNKSLKCYDRAGAEALCVDMPDEWGVRITDHQIVYLREKAPAEVEGA